MALKGAVLKEKKHREVDETFHKVMLKQNSSQLTLGPLSPYKIYRKKKNSKFPPEFQKIKSTIHVEYAYAILKWYGLIKLMKLKKQIL